MRLNQVRPTPMSDAGIASLPSPAKLMVVFDRTAALFMLA
jgi:hypothetical protein